jgi:hypothetical protein
MWIKDSDFEVGGEYWCRKQQKGNDSAKHAHAILLETRKGLLVMAVRTGLLACE